MPHTLSAAEPDPPRPPRLLDLPIRSYARWRRRARIPKMVPTVTCPTNPAARNHCAESTAAMIMVPQPGFPVRWCAGNQHIPYQSVEKTTTAIAGHDTQDDRRNSRVTSQPTSCGKANNRIVPTPIAISEGYHAVDARALRDTGRGKSRRRAR